jgi:hypothetical protein
MTFWILFSFLALQLIVTVAKAAHDGEPLTAVITVVLYAVLLYCVWTLK